MQNQLYPIFLKLNQLEVLIIGGGYVALEKLTFLVKSSPNANISLVALDFIPEVLQILHEYQFKYHHKNYEDSDLINKSIVIGATNDIQVNQQIYRDAKAKKILVNIADNPPLCDFYMGGIVTKGDLKIAISTNGKSPTMAKRIRQYLEESIPTDIQDLLDNLNQFRATLKNDFEFKVKKLNQVTKSFLQKSKSV